MLTSYYLSFNSLIYKMGIIIYPICLAGLSLGLKRLHLDQDLVSDLEQPMATVSIQDSLGYAAVTNNPGVSVA